MLQRAFSIGIGATALVSLTLAAGAQAPSAPTLLAGMARAEQTASYTATQVVQKNGAPKETVHIWRSGRKQRIEWVSPDVRRGDVMVDDGQNVWLFHRDGNTATQTKSMSQRFGARLDNLGKNYTARVVGSTAVAGRKAWNVEFRPRNGAGNRGVRRFSIDAASKIVLRRQRFSPDGRVGESSELQSVRLETIPPAMFVWSPPAGAAVTRTLGTLYMQLAPARRNATWLKIPGYLPPGYVFESAVVDGARGEAWLRYSTGSRRFSIFQQRVQDVAVKPPQVVDDSLPHTKKRNAGVYWQGGGSRFLAVGLDDKDALRVANAVR